MFSGLKKKKDVNVEHKIEITAPNKSHSSLSQILLSTLQKGQ